MIQHVVFDLGNVLVDFLPVEFIKKYTQDEAEAKFLLENIFQSPEWISFDRGTIKKAEIQQLVTDKSPHLAETIAEILANWAQEIKPRTEILDFVKKIKAKGYDTYLLSNAPIEIYQVLDNFPVLKEMKGIFISADWKQIKPEQEIYRSFCSHFNLVPRECVFIDDLATNVEAARQVGMESFVFRKDLAQLEKELASIGVEL